MGKSILDSVDSTTEEMLLNDYRYYNTIYVNDEIDRELQIKFCRQMRKLAKDELAKVEKDREPIKIRITSYGGSVYSYYAMASEIERAKDSGLIVETYCDGFAYSAGAYLLMLGTKGHRYATRYCDILLHQANFGMGRVTHQEAKDTIESLDKCWEVLKDIMRKNTNLTEEEMDNFLITNRDYRYNGEEAIKKGIIDELL